MCKDEGTRGDELRPLVLALVGREEVGCASGSGGGDRG